MKALRVEAFDRLDSLRVSEAAKPVAGAGEVLIAIRAAAVSPLDVKNVQGGVAATRLPRTPGRDFSGVVIEGPDGLRGKEVWGMAAGGAGIVRDGVQAEFAVLAAENVREKPRRLSFAQAAAIGVSHSAAWLGLRRMALKAGETLLIVGSSGSVGRAAIEMARWQGARTIGYDRAEAADGKPDGFIQADAAAETLAEAVRRLTGGRGADCALDAVGGAGFDAVLHSLAWRGRCALMSSPAKPTAEIQLLDFYHQELTLYGIDTLKPSPREAGDLMDEIRPGFEAGALTAPPLREFPLDQAAAAYQAVRAGTGGAKVVLRLA